MWAKLSKSITALTGLINDSDRTRFTRAFAVFSLKRRLIAIILTVLGILMLVGASHSTKDTQVSTLVATHEITSGAVITMEDVTLREWPIHLIADGSFHATEDAIGQISVGAIRRGEVITDARVVGPSLLNESGLVAIAVTLNDLANAQLVHAGDHVDVLASRGDSLGNSAEVGALIVATDVEVLSTKTHESNGVVVLAVSTSQAQAIAGVNERITLVLLG